MTTEEAVLTQVPVVDVASNDIVNNEGSWYERISKQLETVEDTPFYPEEILNVISVFERPSDFKSFAMSIADTNLNRLKHQYIHGKNNYQNKYNTSLDRLVKVPSIVPRTINYI